MSLQITADKVKSIVKSVPISYCRELINEIEDDIRHAASKCDIYAQFRIDRNKRVDVDSDYFRKLLDEVENNGFFVTVISVNINYDKILTIYWDIDTFKNDYSDDICLYSTDIEDKL